MSSTFALSTEQSLRAALRARSRSPTRAMRSISRLRVEHRVEAFGLAARVRAPAARLAEVDVAGQLADDQEVEPGDDLGLERRRRRELRDRGAPGAGSRRGRAPCGCRAMPCSGRSARGSVSYFGPPTAPSSTASALCASASVAGGQRMPARVVAGAADRRGLASRSARPSRRSTSSTRDGLARRSPGRCRRRGGRAIFIAQTARVSASHGCSLRAASPRTRGSRRVLRA